MFKICNQLFPKFQNNEALMLAAEMSPTDSGPWQIRPSISVFSHSWLEWWRDPGPNKDYLQSFHMIYCLICEVSAYLVLLLLYVQRWMW